MQYKVLSSLNYNNQVYSPDAIVDLPEKTGDGLVEIGVLSKIVGIEVPQDETPPDPATQQTEGEATQQTEGEATQETPKANKAPKSK